jgi:hypothetical protein
MFGAALIVLVLVLDFDGIFEDEDEDEDERTPSVSHYGSSLPAAHIKPRDT